MSRPKENPKHWADRIAALTNIAERGEFWQRVIDSKYGIELFAEIEAEAVNAGRKHILGENDKSVDPSEDPVKYAFLMAKIGRFHQGQKSVFKRIATIAKAGAEARQVLRELEEKKNTKRAPGQMTPVGRTTKMGL